MSLRGLAVTAGWLVLGLVVCSLVAGAVLGQPVLLSYVTSASMEPAIEEGEGFVTVPEPLAGDVEAGDVIVFEARELHGGGLTTHRVVAVTDEGYVTKGDANPFTDQDGPEPHVRDRQVVARALQVGDAVVTVPYVGRAVSVATAGTDALGAALGSVAAPLSGQGGVGIVLVGAGVLLVVLATGEGGRARSTVRRRARPAVIDVRLVVGAATVLVVLVATAAMVASGGVLEYGVLVDPEPGGEELVVEPGGQTTVSAELHNTAPVPTVAILEPRHRDVTVRPERVTVGGRSSASVDVGLRAPEERGVHYRTAEEFRYFAVLPPRLLAGLHALHPLVALLAVDLVIGAAVALGAVALVGTDDLRVRSGRSLPLRVRLRRALSRWR